MVLFILFTCPELWGLYVQCNFSQSYLCPDFFEQQGSFTINLDYLEQAKPREDFFFDLLSPGKKKLLCLPADVPFSRLLSSFTIVALSSLANPSSTPPKPALLGHCSTPSFPQLRSGSWEQLFSVKLASSSGRLFGIGLQHLQGPSSVQSVAACGGRWL